MGSEILEVEKIAMLKIETVQGPPNVLLALEGELDLTSAEILGKRLQEMDVNGVTSVTFSLDGLEFIDSTGIGLLLRYYKSSSQRNLAVYIENENEEIEAILSLIGVREIMSP